MTESVLVSLKSADGKHGTVEGTRVCFSVYQCFAVMDEESRALLRRLADHLRQQPGLALWNGPLLEPLLDDRARLAQQSPGRNHGSEKDRRRARSAASRRAAPMRCPKASRRCSSARRAQWSG